MKKSCFKGCFCSKAFTLIELLIVVLIIGVLAAVAVSQYRVAVAKSKLMNAVQIAEQLAKSLEMYRLENGNYPNDNISQLNISFPNCESIGGGGMFCVDTWFDYNGGNEYWDNRGAHVQAAYKSDKKHTIAMGLTNGVFYYYRYLDYAKKNAGKRTCTGINSVGKQVCKSLSKELNSTN